MSAALVDALRQAIGAPHVLTGDGLEAYELDWRRRYHGRALAVARPASTEEVAAIVRLCAQHSASLVPQGGNTGLVGGSVPDGSSTQVVLSLRRMHRIREIDAANLTMTVDAGCVLQSVQEAAERAGLLFALSLAAEGSCTIGGNLATNAGGTQVLRYGNARELCLGLEVVTATGEIWHGLTGLRKDNTGYDLRDLFIGSEGTLGVITGATLKLHPRPLATMTALAAVGSLGQAVTLLGLAQSRLGAGLTGFELMGRFALSLVEHHFPTLPRPLGPAPWTVLLELSDGQGEAHASASIESVLEAAMDAGFVSDAVVAQSVLQSRELWHLRESIPLAQSQEGLNIKHDIALPVSRIPAFVDSTDASLLQKFPGVRLVNFGHLGDGNVHFHVRAPKGTIDGPAWIAAEGQAINSFVHDAVVAAGGSISAEHGIGQMKRAELGRLASPAHLHALRAIKAAFDPQGLMNPGKLIPRPDEG